MTGRLNIGDRVIVVDLKLPENLHLNGHVTTILGIIGKEEAAKRLGFDTFSEKGVQRQTFYLLEDFAMTVAYRTSFGGEGWRKIDFTGPDNLRKIPPGSSESFDEMINRIKNTVYEPV